MIQAIMDKFKHKTAQDCAKQIELSGQAKAIIENPLVVDFFSKADAAILDKWRNTPDDAIDARERLFALQSMLKNFRQYFDGFIINGQFAEKQLEQLVNKK